MQKERKIYAVIDTNVLVSALFSSKRGSNPALVIESVLRGDIIPLYKEDITTEYSDVLSRSKFNFNRELIDALISGITICGINTEPASVADEKFLDPDDIVFYAVSMAVEDSYLVTGNIKHFPKKPFVVTPSEMVEILRSQNLL